MNQPTRAVTGHLWDATEMDYRRAREQYGAIHFHDSDLLDAGWDVGFAFEVPADLPSGVYAARLRTITSEDYVPFFVRPPRGTATANIAFLAPTVSYLAYAGTGGTGFQPMSLYSTHTDGSGVAYSSRLRPITNMRPKNRHPQPLAVHGRHPPSSTGSRSRASPSTSSPTTTCTPRGRRCSSPTTWC